MRVSSLLIICGLAIIAGHSDGLTLSNVPTDGVTSLLDLETPSLSDRVPHSYTRVRRAFTGGSKKKEEKKKQQAAASSSGRKVNFDTRQMPKLKEKDPVPQLGRSNGGRPSNMGAMVPQGSAMKPARPAPNHGGASSSSGAGYSGVPPHPWHGQQCTKAGKTQNPPQKYQGRSYKCKCQKPVIIHPSQHAEEPLKWFCTVK